MNFEKTLLSAGHAEKAPRLGASDVGVGKQDGKRFFASVEPWHGNEVVVYTEKGGEVAAPRDLRQGISGHEIAVVDLNGDGRDDIVANDNSRVDAAEPERHAGACTSFSPRPTRRPGNGNIAGSRTKPAMNSCVGVDINGDRTCPIWCAPAPAASIRWYENKGPARAIHRRRAAETR